MSTRLASRLDLAIYKGTKLVQPVIVLTDGEVKPLPNGTKAKLQIRTSKFSTVTKADLTTENFRLTVDVAAAKVTITMTSLYTAAFNFERGVYDLHLIYPDNEVEQIIEGKVYIFPSITN